MQGRKHPCDRAWAGCTSSHGPPSCALTGLQDKAEALFRLGMSEEAADLIGALSPAQILKIASGNMLLCRFRVDDDIVWNLLTNHNVNRVDNDATTKLHASILMAGRFAEAV